MLIFLMYKSQHKQSYIFFFILQVPGNRLQIGIEIKVTEVSSMDCDVINTEEWNKQIMSSVVFLSSHPQNIINNFYFDLAQPHSKFISCYKSTSTNWKAALKCLFGFSSLSLPHNSTTNTLHHLKHFSVTTQKLQELFKYIFPFFCGFFGLCQGFLIFGQGEPNAASWQIALAFCSIQTWSRSSTTWCEHQTGFKKEMVQV